MGDRYADLALPAYAATRAVPGLRAGAPLNTLFWGMYWMNPISRIHDTATAVYLFYALIDQNASL